MIKNRKSFFSLPIEVINIGKSSVSDIKTQAFDLKSIAKNFKNFYSNLAKILKEKLPKSHRFRIDYIRTHLRVLTHLLNISAKEGRQQNDLKKWNFKFNRNWWTILKAFEKRCVQSFYQLQWIFPSKSFWKDNQNMLFQKLLAIGFSEYSMY